ncbi:unnamed protein product [Amoebophrya sp. A120]|nr:unnamed protein product [Amoebophrya sp. A120]|eukprot:GSA120T00016182001.1
MWAAPAGRKKSLSCVEATQQRNQHDPRPVCSLSLRRTRQLLLFGSTSCFSLLACPCDGKIAKPGTAQPVVVLEPGVKERRDTGGKNKDPPDPAGSSVLAQETTDSSRAGSSSATTPGGEDDSTLKLLHQHLHDAQGDDDSSSGISRSFHTPAPGAREMTQHAHHATDKETEHFLAPVLEMNKGQNSPAQDESAGIRDVPQEPSPDGTTGPKTASSSALEKRNYGSSGGAAGPTTGTTGLGPAHGAAATARNQVGRHVGGPPGVQERQDEPREGNEDGGALAQAPLLLNDDESGSGTKEKTNRRSFSKNPRSGGSASPAITDDEFLPRAEADAEELPVAAAAPSHQSSFQESCKDCLPPPGAGVHTPVRDVVKKPNPEESPGVVPPALATPNPALQPRTGAAMLLASPRAPASAPRQDRATVGPPQGILVMGSSYALERTGPGDVEIPDPPLTQQGKEQARLAGEKFAQVLQGHLKKPDEQVLQEQGAEDINTKRLSFTTERMVFLCSPMLRDMQTLDSFLQGAAPELFTKDGKIDLKNKFPAIRLVSEARAIAPLGSRSIENQGTALGKWNANFMGSVSFLANFDPEKGRGEYAHFLPPPGKSTPLLWSEPEFAASFGDNFGGPALFFNFLRDVSKNEFEMNELSDRTVMIVTDPNTIDAHGGDWFRGNDFGFVLKSADGRDFPHRKWKVNNGGDNQPLDLFKITNLQGEEGLKYPTPPVCQALWEIDFSARIEPQRADPARAHQPPQPKGGPMKRAADIETDAATDARSKEKKYADALWNARMLDSPHGGPGPPPGGHEDVGRDGGAILRDVAMVDGMHHPGMQRGPGGGGGGMGTADDDLHRDGAALVGGAGGGDVQLQPEAGAPGMQLSKEEELPSAPPANRVAPLIVSEEVKEKKSSDDPTVPERFGEDEDLALALTNQLMEFLKVAERHGLDLVDAYRVVDEDRYSTGGDGFSYPTYVGNPDFEKYVDKIVGAVTRTLLRGELIGLTKSKTENLSGDPAAIEPKEKVEERRMRIDNFGELVVNRFLTVLEVVLFDSSLDNVGPSIGRGSFLPARIAAFSIPKMPPVSADVSSLEQLEQEYLDHRATFSSSFIVELMCKSKSAMRTLLDDEVRALDDEQLRLLGGDDPDRTTLLVGRLRRSLSLYESREVWKKPKNDMTPGVERLALSLARSGELPREQIVETRSSSQSTFYLTNEKRKSRLFGENPSGLLRKWLLQPLAYRWHSYAKVGVYPRTELIFTSEEARAVAKKVFHSFSHFVFGFDGPVFEDLKGVDVTSSCRSTENMRIDPAQSSQSQMRIHLDWSSVFVDSTGDWISIGKKASEDDADYQQDYAYKNDVFECWKHAIFREPPKKLEKSRGACPGGAGCQWAAREGSHDGHGSPEETIEMGRPVHLVALQNVNAPVAASQEHVDVAQLQPPVESLPKTVPVARAEPSETQTPARGAAYVTVTRPELEEMNKRRAMREHGTDLKWTEDKALLKSMVDTVEMHMKSFLTSRLGANPWAKPAEAVGMESLTSDLHDRGELLPLIGHPDFEEAVDKTLGEVVEPLVESELQLIFSVTTDLTYAALTGMLDGMGQRLVSRFVRVLEPVFFFRVPSDQDGDARMHTPDGGTLYGLERMLFSVCYMVELMCKLKSALIAHALRLPERDPGGRRAFDYFAAVLENELSFLKNRNDWTEPKIPGPDGLPRDELGPLRGEAGRQLVVVPNTDEGTPLWFARNPTVFLHKMLMEPRGEGKTLTENAETRKLVRHFFFAFSMFVCGDETATLSGTPSQEIFPGLSFTLDRTIFNFDLRRTYNLSPPGDQGRELWINAVFVFPGPSELAPLQEKVLRHFQNEFLQHLTGAQLVEKFATRKHEASGEPSEMAEFLGQEQFFEQRVNEFMSNELVPALVEAELDRFSRVTPEYAMATGLTDGFAKRVVDRLVAVLEPIFLTKLPRLVAKGILVRDASDHARDVDPQDGDHPVENLGSRSLARTGATHMLPRVYTKVTPTETKAIADNAMFYVSFLVQLMCKLKSAMLAYLFPPDEQKPTVVFRRSSKLKSSAAEAARQLIKDDIESLAVRGADLRPDLAGTALDGSGSGDSGIKFAKRPTLLLNRLLFTTLVKRQLLVQRHPLLADREISMFANEKSQEKAEDLFRAFSRFVCGDETATVAGSSRTLLTDEEEYPALFFQLDKTIFRFVGEDWKNINLNLEYEESQTAEPSKGPEGEKLWRELIFGTRSLKKWVTQLIEDAKTATPTEEPTAEGRSRWFGCGAGSFVQLGEWLSNQRSTEWLLPFIHVSHSSSSPAAASGI